MIYIYIYIYIYISLSYTENLWFPTSLLAAAAVAAVAVVAVGSSRISRISRSGARSAERICLMRWRTSRKAGRSSLGIRTEKVREVMCMYVYMYVSHEYLCPMYICMYIHITIHLVWSSDIFMAIPKIYGLDPRLITNPSSCCHRVIKLHTATLQITWSCQKGILKPSSLGHIHIHPSERGLGYGLVDKMRSLCIRLGFNLRVQHQSERQTTTPPLQ